MSFVSLYLYVPDEGSLLPKYRDCTTSNDFELYINMHIYMYIYVYICICMYICICIVDICIVDMYVDMYINRYIYKRRDATGWLQPKYFITQ